MARNFTRQKQGEETSGIENYLSVTMALKEDPTNTLALNIDGSTMGFDNLIGSQARIAKQLDLWWRYDQLPPESSDNVCIEDEAKIPSAPEERLVRRERHSMPFLMRNISNWQFQPQKTYRPRRSRTKKHVTNESIDVISQCFGIGSPNKAKRKRSREDSSGIIGSIRQKITGWFSSDESNTQVRDWAQSPIGNSDVPRSGPLTAYELYTQSTRVRNMVLSEIDPSLHHDEEFILNRIEANWQAMTLAETKDELQNKTTSTVMEGDITKYAYWLDMEEKDKEHFQQNESAQQLQKKQKVAHAKPKPIVTSVVARNRRVNQPVYYHYMYMDEKNHPCTSVEKRMDRKCPLCTYYAKGNNDLLRHCSIDHGILAGYYPWKELGSGFSFEAVLDEERNLHIVVKCLGCSSVQKTAVPDNFTFVKSKTPIEVGYSIPFLRRSHKNAAAMDPLARRRRLLALETNDAPASIISSYLPTDEVPVRQYYHSRTNLPLEDWNDNDSDDEPDEEWLHKMSDDLIGEFEDISDREKKFMQMWNRFIKSHIVIADKEIPGKCKEFIRTHINELKAGGMRSNLLLHLMNLWNSGVVSSNRILACMHQYDNGDAENGVHLNDS